MKTKFKIATISLASLSFVALFFVTQGAFAFDFSNPLVPAGGQNAQGLVEFLLGYLLTIVGWLAVIFIVLGGVLIVFGGVSGGNDKLVTAGKNCIVGAIIGLAIVGAAPIFLTEIREIVFGAGGSMPTTPSAARPFADIAQDTLSFLLSVIGFLATIGIVVGGIMFLTTAANAKAAETAKKIVTFSIIGLAIAGSALIIVSQIDQILTP